MTAGEMLNGACISFSSNAVLCQRSLWNKKLATQFAQGESEQSRDCRPPELTVWTASAFFTASAQMTALIIELAQVTALSQNPGIPRWWAQAPFFRRLTLSTLKSETLLI
jgi:hypothetical protein